MTIRRKVIPLQRLENQKRPLDRGGRFSLYLLYVSETHHA